MATRNLTDKFVKMRQERLRRSGSLGGSTGGALLSDAANTTASEGWSDVKNILPPAWVDMVDDAEADLAAINQKLDTLTNLHTKRLMVTFDDTTEADQDREIDLLSQSVTALFRSSERKLKRISSSGSSSGQPGEAKVRANITRTLASRFQQANVRFRSTQKNYISRRNQQKTGAAGGFDFLSEAENGRAKDPQLTSIDGGAGFTMQQLEVVEDTERMAAERDEQIAKIVETIEELSQIFKELAVLVIDQGTILDRIDYNMEQVVHHVSDGVVALEKAKQYQESARPRYCIATLLVLIAIFLTMLILKHKDNSK